MLYYFTYCKYLLLRWEPGREEKIVEKMKNEMDSVFAFGPAYSGTKTQISELNTMRSSESRVSKFFPNCR